LCVPPPRGPARGGVKVAQADVFDVCRGEAVESLFHAVGEDADDDQHFGPGPAQHVHDLDHAAARGDEILDHDDLLALLQPALDLVLAAVVLGTGAHVTHRQAEKMPDDRRVGDAGGRGAHEHLAVGVLALDRVGDGLLDRRADGGHRQYEAVVAVDGALDAAGPGEGLVRAEEHRPDREKILRDLVLQFHLSVLL